MSLQACADLLRRADPDRFRAVMAAPVAARAVLFPLQAFNIEVARAPWLTQEAPIAEMRLQWWRDALEEIAAGGPVRRHEVVTPLAQVLDAGGARLLDELVQARRWDIYRAPFEAAAHFDEYIARTSSNLMLAGARALGPCEAGVIGDFGHAAGVANFLRAVPALEAAGRVPLLDGRAPAVAALAGDALRRLRTARGRLAEVSPAARPALLSGWQAAPVLARAARAPGLVAEGRLEPGAAAKSWGLLRASLRGCI